MAISGSAQEANVLVQDTVEFSTALTSAFLLLTITMISQHVYPTKAIESYSCSIRG